MPARIAASLVACLCDSLKYAGTVITAESIESPRNVSASFINLRIIELINSSGAYSLSVVGLKTLTLPTSLDLTL